MDKGKLVGCDEDSLIQQQRKNTNTNDNCTNNYEYAKQTIYNTILSPPDDKFTVRP